MPKLFVGNLPFDVADDELKGWVEGRGYQVEEVRVMRDRETGKPRGFAFVTFEGDVHKASAELNGQDFKGRNLTVNEAKPMERRSFGRNDSHGGGGGGGRSRREPRW